MRLLDAVTLQMSDRRTEGAYCEPYAILSHTWGSDEVTLQNFNQPAKRSEEAYRKISSCCEQARKDGIRWVWIDTCCIDKTNSSELSEAINSMFAWYRNSDVCYVFLEDVPARAPFFPEYEFRKARWFTRGWCLQELIAPPKVEFYARDWSDIGTKWSLCRIIKQITRIPSDALLGGSLSGFTVAQRMSWASNRVTTRIEDMAYCLLGIFDVNMPLIYGEGKKAFHRLQGEILKETEEFSFLLWAAESLHSPSLEGSYSIFASRPDKFPVQGLPSSTGEQCRYENMKSLQHSEEQIPGDILRQLHLRDPPRLTSRGLQVRMLVRENLRWRPGGEPTPLLLWTEFLHQGKLICIGLTEERASALSSHYRVRCDEVCLVDSHKLETFKTMDMYLATNINQLCDHIQEAMAPSERPDFEILLSSSPKITPRFVQCIPPVRFFVPNRPLTYSPPPGPRMYALNLNEVQQHGEPWMRKMPSFFEIYGRNRLLSDQVSPILMKFRLYNLVPRFAETTGLLITLWLDPVFPRCYATSCPDPDEVSSEVGKAYIQSRLNDYYQSSDRAECVSVDGRNVITIMVKGSRDPGRFVTERYRRKPAYFTLYVTVLNHERESQSDTEAQENRGNLREPSEGWESCHTGMSDQS